MATRLPDHRPASGSDNDGGVPRRANCSARNRNRDGPGYGGGTFPCTAGDDYHGPIDECEGARLPISLQIALFENDINRSDSVSPSTSVAGGSYVYAGEHPTFTWPVAYADLSSGARYRMVIQSLTDGTVASPANPRLTVEVSTIDLMGESILRLFGCWLAVAVTAVGGIWMLIAYAWAMRRRP